MTTRPKLITAEELLLMPDNDMQHELIRGVLTENVLPGDQHGVAVARIAWLLGNFSGDNDYGEVSGRSGFLLERNPDTVRAVPTWRGLPRVVLQGRLPVIPG